MPKDLLNEKGDVMVDQFLRVKNAQDVWAAGDIVDCQPGQFVYTGLCSYLSALLSRFGCMILILEPFVEKQAAAVAKNLDLTLKGKQPVAYKSDGDRTFHLFPSFLYIPFLHPTAMLAVALGRSRGTGRFGNMKLPSLIVWLVSKFPTA